MAETDPNIETDVECERCGDLLFFDGFDIDHDQTVIVHLVCSGLCVNDASYFDIRIKRSYVRRHGKKRLKEREEERRRFDEIIKAAGFGDSETADGE